MSLGPPRPRLIGIKKFDILACLTGYLRIDKLEERSWLVNRDSIWQLSGLNCKFSTWFLIKQSARINWMWGVWIFQDNKCLAVIKLHNMHKIFLPFLSYIIMNIIIIIIITCDIDEEDWANISCQHFDFWRKKNCQEIQCFRSLIEFDPYWTLACDSYLDFGNFLINIRSRKSQSWIQNRLS